MKIKSFIITIFLAFPIFIRLTSIGSDNFRTVLSISVYIFAMYTLIASIHKKRKLDLKDTLVQFNLYFLILSTLQWYSHGGSLGTFRPLLNQTIPFISSILIIFFIKNYNIVYKTEILNKIIYGIGLIFLFQFSFSLFEVIFNSPLIDYGFLYSSTSTALQHSVQIRSLFSLFGITINIHFALTMLLGQQNLAAPLLVIYNLIFLFAYHHTQKRYFKILVIAVLLASVLNTTRASLLAIIISDLIFYLKFYASTKKYKVILKIVLVIIIIVTIYQISPLLISYFDKTNTLGLRFDIYKASFSYISEHFLTLIWGNNFFDFATIGAKLQSAYGHGGSSFESQFLSVLYLNGFIGLFLFLRFLKQCYFNKLSSNSSNMFLRLLALNIVLTSLTLNGIFSIFTYPIMTVLYLYIKNTDSYLELDRKSQVKGIEYA